MSDTPEKDVIKTIDQADLGEDKQMQCTCVQDPFAALPPELRPKPMRKTGDLRKVTCPSCKLVFWTNRPTDLCIDCEKKGVH
jgi:hypothetical protein